MERIKKLVDRSKPIVMERQGKIYKAMILVGAGLICLAPFLELQTLSHGIAFITVGFVGMLMSWTTTDIGDSIKKAIGNVGEQNKAGFNQVNASLTEMTAILKDIRDSVRKNQD